MKEVGITVNHMKDQIVSYLQKNDLGLNLSFIDQKDLLGTAHALYTSSDYLAGENEFLVAYGDVTLPVEVLRNFMKFHSKHGYDSSVLSAPAVDPSHYGLITHKQDLLEDIVEKPERVDSVPSYVNAGVYVLPFEAISHFKRLSMSTRGEYELTSVLKTMKREGLTVGVFRAEPGWWFDIGRPWDLLDANFTYMDRILEKQAKVRIPGVNIEGKVLIGENVAIKPGTYVSGPCIIGDNVTVGANSAILQYTAISEGSIIGNSTTIGNSLIMENVYIGDNVSLHHSIVGENARIMSGTCVSTEDHRSSANVKMALAGTVYDTGRKRLGAIIGSNSSVAPLSRLFPGQVIMPYSTLE